MNTPTKSAKTINRAWHLIDLKGQTLGRVSTQIASLLMGKNKADFSPNLDMGDYVVAINADQIKVTGNKLADKIYYRHSGFPGGFRQATLGEKMQKDSTFVIRASVKGMLPKNKLQDPRLARLKIFTDSKHPYADKFKNSEK